MNSSLSTNDGKSNRNKPPESIWFASAPGRVNLIGEHTDYNDGFTLPLAIDRRTEITLQTLPPDSSGGKTFSHFYSQALDETAVWSPDGKSFLAKFNGKKTTEELTELLTRSRTAASASPPAWSKYIAGVMNEFQRLGFLLPPLNLYVETNVPLGAGVSSSAALEVAVAIALKNLLGIELSGGQIALLCQRAEHSYAGVPCGLMDQLSSVFGRKNHLMLLDCRCNQIEHIHVPETVAFLVVNSNIKHDLADGEYRKRRAQCEEACRLLQIKSLRDIDLVTLDQNRHRLSESNYRKARHVVSEITRTVEAAALIRSQQWQAVGELMYLSHESMRDDFEISCPEIDQLVEISKNLGLARGMYGARMTGGGFGGCIIGLVESERSEAINQSILTEHKKLTGLNAVSFITRPADGALLMQEK
jgi:galactokinase